MKREFFRPEGPARLDAGLTRVGRGAIALLLVLGFVLSRAALLLTSYDTNTNWEEPVFLFSATELGHDGLNHIFDHQDDLNHGGSVLLLLLAVPWVRAMGTSLVALKGVEILVSGLTLCAFMAVGWRYFSPRIGLLWGLFFLVLSPTAARLNITLVGSHPEAMLPCAAAMAAYLESVRRFDKGRYAEGAFAFALGVASGLALWVAYIAAMFVLPVLILRLLYARRGRTWAAITGGLFVGAAPWMYQNLWLRPHGATLWLRHLGGRELPREGWLRALGELAASFGYEGDLGMVLLAICAAALLAIVLGLTRRRWRDRLAASPRAVLPFVAAPVLGLALLANAIIPLYPNEGYYHYRFFIPLQVALFGVLAIATDWATRRFGRGVLAAVLIGAVVTGVSAQAPLYGQGNHYQPDFERDRAAGCLVYGLAEWDRAAAPAGAVRRLQQLTPEVCRGRAFAGFGWAVANRYLQGRNLQEAEGTLKMIGDQSLRLAACGGFYFALSRTPGTDITPRQRDETFGQLSGLCRPPGAR